MSPGIPQVGHTPGPWVAAKGSGWYVTRPYAKQRRECAIMVGMHADHSLVSTPSIYDDEAEAKANAHLIAAAPDLLAALRDLMAIADPDGEATDIWAASARAAIARATGCAA